VRRAPDQQVRLLVNQLHFLKPGQLLDAIAGRAEWPHAVYQLYWPLARSDSFAAAAMV